eukprot:m51a1_g5972 putative major facilitator subfamily protein (515) ;mRNA; f:231413-233558
MIKATGPIGDLRDEETATAPERMGRVRFVWWLFCVCFSLAGVQFCYSIQFALGTPLFHDELHLDPSTISIILSTAGPISGLIVQPVVGAWSDSLRSRWGRRRPFVAVGAFFCAAGMALIAASVDLGKLLGDDEKSERPGDHKYAIAFAITGLWIMNLFVNTIQGPARAIVADIVPADKQQDGNAMVSGVMGIAAIVANVMGAQLFLTAAPYRNLFAIGVVCVLLSAIPTLVVAKEGLPPMGSDDDTQRAGACGVFGKIFMAFATIPRKMVIVVVVFFLSWCAYSPYMIYITDYFGVEIYKGSTSHDLKERYQLGVQMGMYGLAVFAAVQWLFSFVLSPIVNKAGPAITFAVTQALATGAFVGFYFLARSGLSLTWMVAIAFTLMGTIAINFTTMNSVPFGLVRGLTGNKDAGLYMGVLNAASVVSQTATNLIAGVIISKAPHDAPNHNENVSYGILLGAALSVLAVFAALFLPRPVDETAILSERQPLINSDEGVKEKAPAGESSSVYGSTTSV